MRPADLELPQMRDLSDLHTLRMGRALVLLATWEEHSLGDGCLLVYRPMRQGLVGHMQCEWLSLRPLCQSGILSLCQKGRYFSRVPSYLSVQCV